MKDKEILLADAGVNTRLAHIGNDPSDYHGFVNPPVVRASTVLFPNEFEQNNLLVAGKELLLPAGGAAYQFRLRDKGRETLIGICQTGSKSLEGLQHDFERQRFTMLGDWRAHLAQLPGTTARTQKAIETPRARPQRRAKGRPVDVAPSETRAAPELQARTAIVYDVK